MNRQGTALPSGYVARNQRFRQFTYQHIVVSFVVIFETDKEWRRKGTVFGVKRLTTRLPDNVYFFVMVIGYDSL